MLNIFSYKHLQVASDNWTYSQLLYFYEYQFLIRSPIFPLTLSPFVLDLGTKIDSENPKEKMIALAFYVAGGLSLFAMCFKLMEEEVILKIKRMGRVLGMASKSKKVKAKKSTANGTGINTNGSG